MAEVIVILNRASSIDKHTKKSQNTCLSLLLRELFLRNSSNNASSLAINPSLTFFCFNLGALDSGIVMLKTGLDGDSTVGKLGYWTSRASEIRRQRRVLGGTLSTSPAQFTASMFVNKTKTTLRAHTVDKNTSSVCRSKRRFRPKPHAPVLFLSIYRDTVPLRYILQSVWLRGGIRGQISTWICLWFAPKTSTELAHLLCWLAYNILAPYNYELLICTSMPLTSKRPCAR